MPPAPPPSESQILSHYLLSPSSLPTILTLDQFRSLFPPKLRQHPHIKPLYRDLQFLRNLENDVVRDNISQEVRRGERMRVEMWRSLQAGQQNSQAPGGDGEEDGREGEVDEVLFGGQTGSTSTRQIAKQQRQYHTLETLLQEMERAAATLEDEITATEKESAVVAQEIKETVGGLSDLRYGSFARQGVGEEIGEAVGRLDDAVVQR